DADLNRNKRAKATLSSPALTNFELSASKVGCRTVCSAELVEESVVPMLEYLTSKLARALSQAREDACLNGKAGAALDADASASDDPRRWFNGLREIALNAAMGNGQAVITPATAGRIEVTDLRKLRSKMKKFATRPASGDVVIVTGAAGYMQLLNLTDGNGAPI